ncbi:MAG: PAS domain S-box protein [Candidatus Contendobacter sp.]|nr:PAS domain S-box protein [Candidatus Contendobacter sp.]MDS4058568.1 PAS domain S-box protein [Candidatus Contendobacter sp.]
MTTDRSTALRFAWLPLPILLLAMVGFWLAKPTGAYASTPLLVALNLVFTMPAALTVAVLMGRGFRRQGAPELLWIGGGVLLWALAGLTAASLLEQGANLPITIFNTSVALAAFCHLVGVVWAMRAASSVPVARRGWWIVGAYAAVPAVVAALTWATWTDRLPVFFIQDQGGTPVRQAVLLVAMVWFSLVALLVRLGQRARASAFVAWYSLSLLLLAAHTVAISLQPAVGNALFWTGRAMEYLGGAYLLVAAFSGRNEHGWDLSLADALRASEKRYRQLFESMTEGFALHEILTDEREQPYDYRFLSVNPAFERLTGPKAADLLGKRVREVLPAVEPYWIENYGRVVRTGEPVRFENYSTALGRWYEVFAYRVAPRQFAVAFTDVTERKTAEEALRRSEARFRSIFEHAPIGIAIADWEGRLQVCNPAFISILGYSGEELRGMPFPSLIHPEDREANLLKVQRLKAGELNSFETENRYVREDGKQIWVHKFVCLLPRESATPHLIAMVTDITERKRAEEALREGEQRLRLAQDAARAGTWEWNLQTHENVWSEEIWLLYGLEPHSVQPSYQSWRQTIHPEDRPRVEQTVRDAAREHREFEVEWRTNAPDGPSRWLLARGRPLQDAAGRVSRYLGIVLDITARRRAEETLRLRIAALEAAANAIVITDRTGQIEWVNQSFAALTGYAPDEALGRNHRDLVRSGIQGPEFYANLWRTILAGQVWEGEIVNRRKDCGQYHEFMTVTPVRNHDGTIGHFVAVKQDITARKQTEEALRDSEMRLRLFIEHAPAALSMFDREMRYLFVSRRWSSDYHLGERDLRGLSHYVVFPEIPERWKTIHRRALEGEVVTADNDRFDRADGTVQWLRWEVRPWHDAAGEIGGVVVFSEDITVRRQAEQALRDNEARLRAIVHAVPDVLAVLDDQGRHLEVLTTRSQPRLPDPGTLLGRRLDEVLAAEDARTGLEALRHTLHTGEPQSFEYTRPDETAKPRVFEARVAPLDGPFAGRAAAVMLARDVTQQRLTEASLRQAQKMEAVGQLTGGIAHDFNNLLAVILGNLELLAEQLRDGDTEMRDRVREALAAAERGASLTHRLLIFSRRQPPHPQRTDLNRLVTGMGDLLRRSLGETVALEMRLAPDLFPTMIDPGQFETALLNLAVNAHDAMPDGGQLTIETANYWLHEDAAHAALHRVAAGQYVALTVSDTGQGMTPDVQRRAFEPFFTTKEVGRGTGLGLSMVHGLVEQSGGFIHLHSQVSQGTSIHLHFPAAEAVDADVHAGTSAELARSKPRRQTILVVEDENAVRRLAVRMLESLGYRTVEADTAEAALAVLEATPQVAMLFTDVVLPGPASGVDLARQALQRRPDLKVLFVSGYVEAHLSRFQDRPEGSDLLDKPYLKAQLAEKLHALLGDAPEGSK